MTEQRSHFALCNLFSALTEAKNEEGGSDCVRHRQRVAYTKYGNLNSEILFVPVCHRKKEKRGMREK